MIFKTYHININEMNNKSYFCKDDAKLQFSRIRSEVRKRIFEMCNFYGNVRVAMLETIDVMTIATITLMTTMTAKMKNTR